MNAPVETIPPPRLQFSLADLLGLTLLYGLQVGVFLARVKWNEPNVHVEIIGTALVNAALFAAAMFAIYRRPASPQTATLPRRMAMVLAAEVVIVVALFSFLLLCFIICFKLLGMGPLHW